MRRMLLAIAVIAVTDSMLLALPAEAGPLLDWWRSRPRLFGRSEPVPAVTAFSPAMGGACTTCTQTCQRVSVNYVPETSYRSMWVQTPVTSYRPSTSTDPCTGCQVTCMRPCTTYQWSLRRIPYTTYRPVYQTQTVQMPVTVSSGGCSSCNVASAPTYSTPTTYAGQGLATASPYPNSSMPVQSYGTSNGTYPGYSSSGATTPADMQPSLGGPSPYESSRVPLPEVRYDQNGNPVGSSILTPESSYYRPQEPSPTPAPQSDPNSSKDSVDRSPRRIETDSGMMNRHSPLVDPQPGLRRTQPATAPPLLPVDGNTAAVQLHRPWDYSPVRLASYESPVREPRRLDFSGSNQSQPTPASTPAAPPTRKRAMNPGWRSVN